MQIDRVLYTPRKDVYYPGEVVYVSVLFREPFVGECEIGFAALERGGAFRRTTCRQSTTRIYEGQINIQDDEVGPRVLEAALTPVKGDAVTVAASDRIFQIQPLRP